MKKILSFGFGIAFLISLTGCLKDKALTDFSDIKPIVELPYHGMEGFASDAVLTAGQTAPITIPIVVNLASKDALTKDLAVTLAIDDALRTQYNAKGGVQYEALPADAYSFPSGAATIPAGKRLDTVYVTFYPDKIDPSKNFMLPIKISDAQGTTVSGNFGIAYFHMIGNPLAGNYTWDFYRWNNNTGTGTLSGASFMGDVVTFLPDDPTTVEFPTGYFTQPNYVMTFDNNGGTLSNFSIAPSAAMLQSWSDNGISIVDGPTLLLADPVAKHFKVKMIVWNGSAFRYLIDDYYQ